MKSKKNAWTANCVLVLCSLIVLALFSELVVFRLLFKASDIPQMAFENEILKYKPGQSGTYRVRDDISARFSINAQGWNSGHPEYKLKKQQGVKRIALIGDSYVAAFQTDHDKSMAENLERMLGPGVEVYRFGVSGAPMSQYLHMLHRAVLQYEPDLVIVNLVHNDFDESYRFKPGVYTSSFMKLEMDGNNVMREIRPVPFKEKWFEPIRTRSAIWGYLAIRRQIRFNVLRDLFIEQDNKYQANIDLASIKTDMARNRAATEYVLAELSRFAMKSGIELMLVMDGVRDLAYRGEYDADPSQGALALNGMVRECAEKLSIDFLDLHPVFMDRYRSEGKKFNSPVDGHWNEYGHLVAAGAVRDFIRDRNLLRQ